MPLWGAPRIHGELLKLGFEVAQSTVAKYMIRRRGPPSQGWRTFLRNHAPDIAAMDLFVVPTVGFSLLYAFVIVRLDRRALAWINVTQHPTAEWVARQLTEAFPWDEAPGYLIRDNDRIYRNVTMRRIRAMGIRDKPIAPGSPWQNGFFRTADRIDPARVPRSPRRPGRGAPASDCSKLRRLLQQSQDAPVARQRCACVPCCSAGRENRVTSYLRRTSSPLCADLGFQHTQVQYRHYTAIARQGNS